MHKLYSIKNRVTTGAGGICPRVAALSALIFFLSFFLPLSAPAEKGAMEFGISSHYVWPQMDAEELEPAPDWGFIFHYWFNTTTSLELGFEQLSFEGPLTVDGQDEGIVFTAGILEVGVRYRPEVDFYLKPYLEAGMGYQFWNTDPGPDFIEGRNGGSVTYLAGTGLEQVFFHAVTAGLNLRYFYMPMREQMERKAVSIGGRYEVEDVKLENTGYLSAGVELVWRFK